MSRFLGLIVGAAMALFIAGPAMAEHDGHWTVDKSYTFDKDSTHTKTSDLTVTKEVEITVEGDIEATGGIDVQGDVVFKEMDVEVQDEEVVNKFFELDDSATSRWSIDGNDVMSVAEQLQNGADNDAFVDQLTLSPTGLTNNGPAMHVALQYQVGTGNDASITQRGLEDTLVNNFAKQIQIGDGNIANISQNF